jgi:hypothetical protein
MGIRTHLGLISGQVGDNHSGQRSQLCGRIRMTFAAWMKRVLRYLLPRLEMWPRIDRPPVMYWRSTGPSCAPKSRPRSNALPVRTNGGDYGGRDQQANAGNAREGLAVGSLLADLLDLVRDALDSLIEAYLVFVEASDQAARPWRYLVLAVL